MKIRTGRKNRHNLYLQLGDEPNSEVDVCLGLIISPVACTVIADALNRSGKIQINPAAFTGPERIANALERG